MDIALKQRLVGAIVLIALAVVVLPMLLSGRPEDAGQEAQKIELPPAPANLDFQTRRFPVQEAAGRESAAGTSESASNLPALPQPAAGTPPSAETASATSDGAGDSDAQGSEAGRGQLAQVEVQPRAFQDALQEGAEAEAGGVAAEPPQEPVAAAADTTSGAAGQSVVSASTSPAPVGKGRYVVQVASFGSTANAKRLADTLRGDGYTVLSDTVNSDVGTLHRVRVGPYATEADAGAAANRIRQQLADVQPRVVDLQPEQAAQVTAPSDPLVRWVVQVGSFSSADNAAKLVQQLRELQLSAYQEAVSSGGKTIHRVRTGPYVEREEALRVDSLIRERLALDGVVMSAD